MFEITFECSPEIAVKLFNGSEFFILIGHAYHSLQLLIVQIIMLLTCQSCANSLRSGSPHLQLSIRVVS